MPNLPAQITDLSGVALSAAIHARKVSCVEVLHAYLAQIDALNPQVNAIVALQDRETLLAQAQRLDLEMAQGCSRGLLHGIPQAPKDILPVQGMVTTRGSPLFVGQVSEADAIHFERMRASGAVFVGRTNSPEFGLGGHTYNPVYGATRNAWVPTRSAGGSSGGAAVATALHMLPFADGSDMMGSLRTPAAFNNVYGFRPSLGAVPYGPAEELFLQQYSTNGPMARNVPDLALQMQVMAGGDARTPLAREWPAGAFPVEGLERDFQGAHIGWLGDWGGHLAMEPGLLAQQEAALEHFRSLGAVVEPAVLDFDLEQLWEAWLDLRSLQVAGGNLALYTDPAKRSLLKPEAVWEIERGMRLSGMRIYEAAKVRSSWYLQLQGLLERFDYLVMPCTQVYPFAVELDWPHTVGEREMDTYHRWMEVVIAATMAGLPALAVPAGINAQGLPAGIQIVGGLRADWPVLQLGHAYDEASGYSQLRSPLLESI
ncbi:amidase [Comamonas odontotermitis]|uniref:Amidase n=1 Tax=Comamonas odontotermitis TaxID=379895 RepID=A0ABR6RG78_9BURK|nr:amidase [Comamonas odontotermitis]MBB6578167.1 amidase [Comamonas odontotermitis]